MPESAPLTNPFFPFNDKKHPIKIEIIFINKTTKLTTLGDKDEILMTKAKINIPTNATIKDVNALLRTDGKNFSFIFDCIKNPLLITIDMQGEFV